MPITVDEDELFVGDLITVKYSGVFLRYDLRPVVFSNQFKRFVFFLIFPTFPFL